MNANSDLAVSFEIGRAIALGFMPLFDTPRSKKGLERAGRYFFSVGSVRGMQCRMAYWRGVKHGKSEKLYWGLWNAFQGKAD